MPVGPTASRVMPPIGVVIVVGGKVSDAGGGDVGAPGTVLGESVADPGAIVRLGVLVETLGAVAAPVCGVRYDGGSHEAAAGVLAVAAGVVTVAAGVVTVTPGVVTVVVGAAGVGVVTGVTVRIVAGADAGAVVRVVGTVTVGTDVGALAEGAATCCNFSASALPGIMSLSPSLIVILSGGMLFIFCSSETEVPCLFAIFHNESPGCTV